MLQRMRDVRNAARNGDEGFTLIELLIVIVVLGVLAGITVFGVAQFKSDSEVAACSANKKTVEVAAEAFNAKTGGYPASVAALVAGNYLKSAPAGVTTAGGVTSTSNATCT